MRGKMDVVFKWPLEKIIDGLCAKSIYRTPSKSPKFTYVTEEKIATEWHMEMKKTETSIEFKLCLSDATANYFLTDFEIMLKSPGKLKWAFYKKKVVFSLDFKPDYCINSFICSNVLRYLYDQNHSFKIICRMNLKVIGRKVNSVPSVAPDFENLMRDTEFSDLTLIASQKEFKVHKNILAARSKIFSDMISQITKENEESIILIDEFDADVVQELIRYIYCGKVANLSKLSKSLLTAAEKYDIEGLKIICLEDFCKTVTIENACKLLILLEQYKVNDLKSQVMDFVVHHLLEISKSDFAAFSKSPNLLKEIFFKTVSVYVEGN